MLVTVLWCVVCSGASIVGTAFMMGAHIRDKDYAKKLKPIGGDMAKCPNCAAVLRIGTKMNVTRYCDCCGQRVTNDKKGVSHAK